MRPSRGGAATKPTVLFEVLSESAEAYDRGEKFENYKSIPSQEARYRECDFSLLARSEV